LTSLLRKRSVLRDVGRLERGRIFEILADRAHGAAQVPAVDVAMIDGGRQRHASASRCGASSSRHACNCLLLRDDREESWFNFIKELFP
jgi:hypothetical protein